MHEAFAYSHAFSSSAMRDRCVLFEGKTEVILLLLSHPNYAPETISEGL